MIIKYRLADGKVIDVDVSPEVAAALAEFDRKEASWRRKARRHNDLSLSAIEEDCAWRPTAQTDILEQCIAENEHDRLAVAMADLGDINKLMLHALFFVGITARDFAAKMGVSYQSVYKRLNKTLSELRGIMAS